MHILERKYLLAIGVSVGASFGLLCYWIQRRRQYSQMLKYTNEQFLAASTQQIIKVVNSSELLLCLMRKSRQKNNIKPVDTFIQEEIQALLDDCRSILQKYSCCKPSELLSEASSYASALEGIPLDQDDLHRLLADAKNVAYPLYLNALSSLKNSPELILDKNDSANKVNCCCNVEYLAKVICIREASDYILNDDKLKNQSLEHLKSICVALIKVSGYNSEKFENAFTNVLTFVNDEKEFGNILKELYDNDFDINTIYDVIIENLLDVMENLAFASESLEAIKDNTWLTDSLKKKGYDTAIWAMHARLRSSVIVPNGLIIRLITLSENILPALAWGLLGSDNFLNDTYLCVLKLFLKFCSDIFSFSVVSYVSVEALAKDIVQLIEELHDTLLTFIEIPHVLV